MKRLLTSLLLVVFVSCATSHHSSTKLAGSWDLTLFSGSSKSFAELFGERHPQLQFDSNNRLSGTTGCNRISGTYQSSNDELLIGKDLITTKMACPGYDETIFIESLTSINHYRLNGNELQLYNGSALIMSFTKK